MQSQAGAVPHGPGSERLTVFEPQAIVVFRQGPRFTHRIWVPLDIVTAASPNAIDRSRPVDMVSQASRQTESGSVAWDSTYQIDLAGNSSTATVDRIAGFGGAQ